MPRLRVFMSRRFAIITTVALVVTLSSILFSPYIHATSTLSSTSDFSSLEKTCAMTDATLHGTQSSTTSCAHTKAKDLSAVSSHIGVGSCNLPGVTMEILYNNYGNILCFMQKGYSGYRVDNVDEVISPTHIDGWFRGYLHGNTNGETYNLNAGNNWDVLLTSPSGSGMVDITQIDPGT